MEFIKEWKELEAEILALKTAEVFTAVAPAHFQSLGNLSAGIHTINYADGSTPLFSVVGTPASLVTSGVVYASTPGDSTQIINVVPGSESGLSTLSVLVASNRSVIGID